MIEYLFILAWIILPFAISYTLIKWVKNKEALTKIEELRVVSQFKYGDTKEDVSKFLDSFIEDCLKDYVLNNIVPDTGLTYIQKDRETLIRKELIDIVSRRMSTLVHKKILMCYSQDYLAELLAEKIFYIVSIYVADFNMEKPQSPKPTPKNNKIIQNPIDDNYPNENDW